MKKFQSFCKCCRHFRQGFVNCWRINSSSCHFGLRTVIRRQHRAPPPGAGGGPSPCRSFRFGTVSVAFVVLDISAVSAQSLTHPASVRVLWPARSSARQHSYALLALMPSLLIFCGTHESTNSAEQDCEHGFVSANIANNKKRIRKVLHS